jgi:hypothetical protein
MSETAFILENCNKAIGGSDEASHLIEQKSRLEQAVSNNDPALTLDTAKSLLESIFKTILSDRIKSPDLGQNLNPLYKNVRDVLVLNQDDEANEILKRLTNGIVHNVAELRNKYGAASHGDDGYYENPIEMPEAEMVAYLVDGMGGFLYRKHKHLNDPEVAQRIFYRDFEGFNDWLDSQYDPIKSPIEGAKEIIYSYFLFSFDVNTYRAMLLQYIDSENEDNEVVSDEVGNEVKVQPQEAEEQIPDAIEPLNSIQLLMDALIINDEVRHSISEEESELIALFIEDYAMNKAGFDWENRDPLIARFRIALKRVLIRYTYSETHMDQAIDLMIQKSKEFYPSK